jgi:hypothetical protein
MQKQLTFENLYQEVCARCDEVRTVGGKARLKSVVDDAKRRHIVFLCDSIITTTDAAPLSTRTAMAISGVIIWLSTCMEVAVVITSL